MALCRNVLEYLEASAARYPEKVAVADGANELTYRELLARARALGSALGQRGVQGRGVIVAMEKSCETIAVMMGALYAGGYYVPVDPAIPPERFGHIVEALQHPLVVVDGARDVAAGFAEACECLVDVAELENAQPDENQLARIRRSVLVSDPAYVLFTSGSTGVPKGVAISHLAISSFIDSFTTTFGITSSDRIANQAPLDFDVSTKDIYGAFSVGATLVLIPRDLFMQPVALVDYLEKHCATVLIWAVAALCIVSSYHALKGRDLPDLRLVMFSGEVMPCKHLAAWREGVPQATFVNLYGPTEITCNCLYHVVDGERDYAQGLPLGEAFSHCEVLIVGDDGKEAVCEGAVGEIVVRGPSVALGYVGLPEVTARVFTQNPLHDNYPDRVYHTGDLAARSATGELYFAGRKDNQIKYMGHRVELEEIDLAVERIDGVVRCRCVFDAEKKRLKAFYEGAADESEVRARAAESLPVFMRPSVIKRIDEMPLTKNGKVDRAKLLEMSSVRRRRED